uniref:Uncharacterized protein n=1 Tax=Physcomitrium patens TaxID=3218 RepID=A0A2K1KBY9_PHYPA|nr:hypothetical protein PHYPA_010476 [Physcomitrium patens]
MSRKALIGHVPRNPGPQILREWAQKSLHGSFQSLSMLGGGFFEIFFAEEEGRTHALARQHYINQTEVCFTPWRSNFNPRAGTDPNSRLAHPAWAQIHGLPTLLRTPQILAEIVNQFAEVIWIDTENQYREKAAGPRVRIMVKDINSLPSKVSIPNLHDGNQTEYYLEYNGLPTQCNRCRSTTHQVRNCPIPKPAKEHKQARLTKAHNPDHYRPKLDTTPTTSTPAFGPH